MINAWFEQFSLCINASNHSLSMSAMKLFLLKTEPIETEIEMADQFVAVERQIIAVLLSDTQTKQG